MLHTFDQHQPMLAWKTPDAGRAQAIMGPTSAKLGPGSAEYGPISAIFDQEWPSIDQKWREALQKWPDIGFGQISLTLARNRAILVRIRRWPLSAKVARASSSFGLNSAKFATDSVKVGPKSAKLGRIADKFGPPEVAGPYLSWNAFGGSL